MEQIRISLPDNTGTLKLPTPEIVSFWRLAEERMFFIDFEIDEELLEISKQILYINMRDKGVKADERQPIKLFIYSYGGDLSAVYSLISVIEASDTPIWTVNLGVAYSAGMLLLLSGSKRFGLKRSQVLAHSGSASLGGTYEQLQENQKSYDKMVQDMRDYILVKTKINPKLFNKNKNKDWYMSDEEQLEYGVIDKIVNSLSEVI